MQEITVNLRQNETFENRPDLLCRVFKQKLNILIRKISKGQYFGRCWGYTYTIEFQKHGQPHAHILVWIDDRDIPLDDPAGIDSEVSACIPGAVIEPQLLEIIQKYHIHGPCDIHDNPKQPCMEYGKCKKENPL